MMEGLRGTRLSPRLLTVGILAGVAAAVVGAWVDRTSPNPVYGWQVITLGVALVLALIGATLIRRGPVGEAFAVASVAGLFGVVIGMSFFGAPKPEYATGPMTLRLERPFTYTGTGLARCTMQGDVIFVGAELPPLPLENEHHFMLFMSEAQPESGEPLDRADGRGLEAMIEEPQLDPEGESRAVSYVATSRSRLVGDMDASGGRFEFDDLRASVVGDRIPAGLEDGSFAGTVEWGCVSE
jgi:hypothetical protein